jgi:uncharacterized membrane protein YidH (DUF202 family)
MVRYALLQLASLLSKDDVDIPKTDFGPDNMSKVLTAVFATIGGVALIIIVISGFKFITSQGNPDQVAKARNTIIYAAVGLVICVGALTIVNLVTGRL